MNTTFLAEVRKQPQSLRETLATYSSAGYAPLLSAAELLRGVPGVVLTGMGTSYNSALCCLQRLGRICRASAVQGYQLLQDDCAEIGAGDAVILISQSGESGEIIRLCEKLHGNHALIGITNNLESHLAHSVDSVLPLFSPEEKTITNSTFTATLAVLQLLAACLSEESPEALASALAAASRAAERFLENETQLETLSETLAESDRVHFIGCSGSEMALAEQMALIFKEGADCNAQCFNLGGFRHGPVELCGPEEVGVLFAGEPASASRAVSLSHLMRKNGSKVLLLTNQVVPEESIYFSSDGPETFSVPAAILMEAVMARVACRHGKEAGVFRISQKICCDDYLL